MKRLGWLCVVTMLVGTWLATVAVAQPVDPIPMATVPLRLLDDTKLRLKGLLPEVAPFDRDPGDQPWIAAEADASLPARAGHARFGLGIGRLGFQLDTSAIAEGSAARVRVRLRLDAGLGRLVLKLPDVKLTPHFDKGEMRFDYVIPIVEGRF